MISQIKRLSQDHWPVFLLSNISSIINLVLPIALVRLLSPENMGIYKTFFLYLSLIPFLTMAGGPPNSIYYWVGKRKEETEIYIQSVWTATMILSSLILIPGLIVIFLFPDLLPLSQGALLCAVLCGFMTCPSSHYGEVCIAQGKTFIGAFLGTSFELVKTLGLIYVAWKYRNAEYLFYYFLFIMTASMIFMTILGFYKKAIAFSINLPKIREIFTYSLPISFGSFLLFITEKADLLIISNFVAADSFAFYSIGCLVIPPLFLLEGSVQKTLIPKLSMSYNAQDLVLMRSQYQKAISDIAYLVIPAVFGLVIYANPITEFLYTREYLPSAHYLQIFAFSYLLLLIPHDSILRATGKTESILKAYLLITPFSLIAIYLSARHLSMSSVLIISLLIKIVPKFYCLSISKNILLANYSELLPLRKIFSFFAVSIALTILSYITQPFFNSKIQWFLITAPLFATFYLGFFVFTTLKKT